MSYKEITAGKKLAKAVTAKLTKSQNTGTWAIKVTFEFEEPSTGNREKMDWYGYLTENSKKNTLRTLVTVLDWNGSEEIDKDGTLIDPRLFDFQKEVELVVESEVYNGKSRMKIKWVNNIGGNQFAGIMPEEVKALDLKGQFLSLRQELNMPAQKQELPF